MTNSWRWQDSIRVQLPSSLDTLQERLTSRPATRSIVVDRLRDQFKDRDDVGIACIYCNYKDRPIQTLDNLIASLWMQLAHDLGSLDRGVKDLYKSHIEKSTRPTRGELVKVLQSEVSRYAKVFVIVDALDEISEDQARTNLVTQIHSLRPTVNLMVTSRFLSPIAGLFENANQLEVSASVDDVRKYVEGRIPRENRLLHLIQKDAKLGEDIMNTIVRKSQKMYVQLTRYLSILYPNHAPQVFTGAASHGFACNETYLE
jgi:hypothetical protein